MAPWEIFAPDQLATILGARTCQHMLNGFGYFTWADQEGLDVQETCFLRLSHLFLSNGNEIDLHLVEGWKVRLYRGIIYQIVEIYYIILYIYNFKKIQLYAFTVHIYIYIIFIYMYRIV